jgi:peptidoglycan/xylan/chitin deacetylase (PgdA/CDA1 family)
MAREAAEGHTVAIHSYTHEYKDIYTSEKAFFEDLHAQQDLIYEQTGQRTTLLRFPGGSSNESSKKYCKGIMTKLTQAVTDQGYQYYDWDVSCGDGAVHTADELVAATMAEMHDLPTNFVFLIHDGAGKQTSVEALPRIIDYSISEGYLFAPIDRTTRVCHHGISN